MDIVTDEANCFYMSRMDMRICFHPNLSQAFFLQEVFNEGPLGLDFQRHFDKVHTAF